MNKRLPLYIADIAEPQDRTLNLSIVKRPAIGMPWKVLEQTNDSVKVFAPILTANKPIYRNNEAYGEHYVMFTPDVVSDVINDFSRRGITFDIEHSGKPVNGVRVLESWQIDYSTNKLYKAYPNLTDGTWVMVLCFDVKTFDVSGLDVKNMVNGGRARGGCRLDIFPNLNLGISISGIFTYYPVSLSEAIEFYNKIKF